MKIRSLLSKLSPLAILFLSACGGGGSPGSTATPTTPVTISKTGVFIDSVVEGLDIYVDGIKIGSSNAKGEFSYPEGKEVTATVGFSSCLPRAYSRDRCVWLSSIEPVSIHVSREGPQGCYSCRQLGSAVCPRIVRQHSDSLAPKPGRRPSRRDHGCLLLAFVAASL